MKRLLILLAATACLHAAAYAQAALPLCPIDTIDGTPLFRYTVEKSIGLYRISVNFGVTQEDIIRYNPQLRERGLHFDETIYIPVTPAALAAMQPIPDPAPAPAEPAAPVLPAQPEQPELPLALPDTPAVPAPLPLPDTLITLTTPADSLQPLRLAVLLPLHTAAVERTPVMERFFDFYQGALLAAHDIQATGQPLELFVYDIEKSNLRLEALIEQGKLQHLDAIVGPAYPAQVSLISDYVAEKHIPTLIPFTDEVVMLPDNPYLLQFNAPDKQEALALADYIAELGDSVNVVLVQANEADIPPSIREIRAAIRNRQIPTTTTTIRHILADSLAAALVPERENILVFNTERYSNLHVLMPRIIGAQGDHRLTLLSHYSWLGENIALPQLYTTEFATAQPADLTDYNRLFDRYFGNDHAGDRPRYDLLGYDMLRFIAAWLRGQEYNGLQSDIHMEQVAPEGGYVNTRIHVLRR
ncbi:MAG: ABC transporter substrate-binding protein [Paludibacteraceae bacterium]|nr:ABC transporter substrate-binding protein [Paludibacteraceae bacterium]